MDLLQVSQLALFLILIVQCETKTEIGDYIVDCSACNSVPVQDVSSYSCKIRCETQGEASTNLTTLYDMLTRMSRQLETVTNDLLETKKKLNETEEKLKIGVAFRAEIKVHAVYNKDDRVIFDEINSNIGNGNDSNTGIFTVPYNGTYDLTLTNMGRFGAINTNLMGNEKRLCGSYAKESHTMAMCSASERLVEGDQVWANAVNNATYFHLYTSLSGHLIHLD